MRIAAIDIGSNSIHLVIAEVESDGRFRVLDRAKENIRLGRKTLSKGRLSEEAIAAGLETLSAFKTLAERHQTTRIEAVATCAVREASNAGDFVQRAKREIGLRINVIPGREEARLISLGVAHAIDLHQQPSVILDAGGGSVELVLTEAGRAMSLHSLKLGVSRLTERFLEGDPPTAKSLKALAAHVDEKLTPVVEGFRGHGVRRVIGTSGTMLNLIAIAGHRRGTPPEGYLDNFEVGADEITLLRRQLERSDRKSRASMKGLDAKRVDMIIAGAIIADQALRKLRAVRLVGCTWALREGVLLDYIARHPRRIAEADAFTDPRKRSVARLLRRFRGGGEHGKHVAELADQLFYQLRADLELDEEAREPLRFAALLHDIGHDIRHKDHQKHSYYLITSCDLLGFRREELEVIALVARYHRKAPPKDSDPEFAALGKAERRTVRALAALLRVADGLDRTHHNVVREVTARRSGKTLALELKTEGDDAAMEIWEARRRANLLEQLLDGEVEFTVGGTGNGEAATTG